MDERGVDREAVREYDQFWQSRQRPEVVPEVERVGWGPFSTAYVVRPTPPPGHHDAEYDVVVLGAGPTGMLMAAYLARMGHGVLVVERQPRLFCGSTWNLARDELAVLEQSEILTEAQWVECTTGEFARGLFRLHEPGTGKEQDHEFANCLNVSIDEAKYFEFLALTPGLEIWTGTSAELVTVDASGAYVECHGEGAGDAARIIQARLVVDARGWTSPLARAVHPRRQVESVYNILGVQTHLEDRWPARDQLDGNENPLADEHGNPLGIICATYRDVQLIDGVRAQPILERFTDFAPASKKFGQGEVLYLFTRTPEPQRIEPMIEPMLQALPRVVPGFAEDHVVKTLFGHAPAFYRPGPFDRWRLQTSAGDRVLLLGVAAQQYSGMSGCAFGPAARNMPRMAQEVDRELTENRLSFSDLARIDIDVRERHSQAIGDVFGGTMAVTQGETDVAPNTDWLIFCTAANNATLSPAELGEALKDKIPFSTLAKMVRMAREDPRVTRVLFENNPGHELDVVWTLVRSAVGLLAEEIRLAIHRGDPKYRDGVVHGGRTLPALVLDAGRLGGGRILQRMGSRRR